MRPAPDGPPTVVYLVDRYPQVSETFVRLEIDALRRQGLRVDVLALDRGDAVADVEVTYLSELRGRRRLVWSHLRWALRSPIRYLRFLVAVRAAQGAVPWRVLPMAVEEPAGAGARWVHAHFAVEAADVAMAAAALLGVPWSLTAHAWDVFVAQRRLDLKFARAACVVTVCEYNRAWLEARFDVQHKLLVVVCGVQVPELRPVRKELDVVAVGRLVPKKGFDVLMRALPEVVRAHPGVRIEIIGDGPEGQLLESLRVALGLTEHVRLRGALPHSDVLDRIASSRILALPARVAADGDCDSMPLVGKEALARAVPVVATTVGGIPEMVDARCGRVVASEDPLALAGAIDELLSLPELIEELGRAGRERVCRCFQVDDEVAKLAHLFTTGRPPLP